jgi:hypothetical protein
VAILCVEVGVPEVSSIIDSSAADTKTALRVLFSRGSASVTSKASVKPHTASEPTPLSCALVMVAVAAVASLSDCATCQSR